MQRNGCLMYRVYVRTYEHDLDASRNFSLKADL